MPFLYNGPPAELEKFFLTELEKRKISLSSFQLQQFFLYLRELKRWNQKINLTSIIGDKEIIVKHFIDSLSCSLAFPTMSDKRLAINLLDVGSGAGFPGIPLKIYFPSIWLSLLESTQKKVNFLEYICKKLVLERVKILGGRAEEYGQREGYRQRYDIVVSRAVGKLDTLAELCLPFVKIGGIFVAQKGAEINKEFSTSVRAIEVMGGEIEKIIGYPFSHRPLAGLRQRGRLVVDSEEIKRNLLVIRKIKPTPDKYPRRSGIPAKRPIK